MNIECVSEKSDKETGKGKRMKIMQEKNGPNYTRTMCVATHLCGDLIFEFSAKNVGSAVCGKSILSCISVAHPLEIN